MDAKKIALYNAQKANPSTVWLLFLFLGWSYGSLGQIGKQIAYYFTLGGLGLWMLYRLFTLSGAITKYNKSVATRVGLSHDEMIQVGAI